MFSVRNPGEQAIRLAVESPPDMILLDLMMPGMNGLAVLRALRSNKTLEEVPVIFQTAHADEGHIIAARRLGCESFLCKPLNKDRLLAEMGKRLKSQPNRRSGRGERPEGAEMPQKLKELTTELADAKTLSQCGRLVDGGGRAVTVDGFRNLIPANSAIGERLLRLANSAAHGGRSPVRTVAEAVVRIGVGETKSLIQKASSAAARGVNTGSVLKALELLEILVLLFPDRTSTSDGTLSLLDELNTRANDARSNVNSARS